MKLMLLKQRANGLSLRGVRCVSQEAPCNSNTTNGSHSMPNSCGIVTIVQLQAASGERSACLLNHWHVKACA